MIDWFDCLLFYVSVKGYFTYIETSPAFFLADEM